MNNVPARIQRIIKDKFFERLSWESIALRMGRTATADSVRMKLERFSPMYIVFGNTRI